MLESLFIVIIALLPTVFSLVMLRRTEAQTRQRLRLAANRSATRLAANWVAPGSDQHYVEGIGYMIGDLTCQFNARSSHLRCAVNPSGPCQGCSHYQSIEFS